MVDLALDCGITGAALLGVEGRARCLVRWWDRGRTPAERVYDLLAVHSNGHTDRLHGLRRPWQIGAAVARVIEPYTMLQPLRFGVEDIYVGKNAKGAVDLAKFAGALAAYVEPKTTGGPLWVTAGSWRSVAFRRGWWSSQAAAAGMTHRKKLATDAVPWMPKRDAAKLESLMTVPLIVPGLRELLDATPEKGRDHATDAGGVFAWMQRA